MSEAGFTEFWDYQDLNAIRRAWKVFLYIPGRLGVLQFPITPLT